LIRFAKSVYLAAVYFFLYVPIIVLVAFSFNRSKFAVGWKGFSLGWYVNLFHDSQLLDAALNSLTVATVAATAAALLGTMAALAVAHYDFKGKRLLHASLFVVIMSPDIVMGVSLLMLFVATGLEPGFLTLLLAHITFCLPFVAVTVHSRLKGFDRHVLEAARDLGAGEYEAFRHVILPMIMPAVLGGWLLSFALSLDDVIISFFLTGPGFDILPLRIYSMVKLGVKPVVNALCTLMVGVTVVIVFAAQLMMREKR
jgi:spermidine/putrescine transport system permease protein